MNELAAFTKEQIDALDLEPGRPLIVSDADEVIVHFARPLEAYLARHDMVFEIKDYRLHGNVRRRGDNSVVPFDDLMDLIDSFFDVEVENLPPVEGAVSALNELATRAQVVVLTNVPAPYRTRRMNSFHTHGLVTPLIANTGLKGAPMKALADRVQAPVVFIDDIDRHISSVAQWVPNSYRVQFIADDRLAALQGQAEHAHHRCDRWHTTRSAIETFLKTHGF